MFSVLVSFVDASLLRRQNCRQSNIRQIVTDVKENAQTNDEQKQKPTRSLIKSGMSNLSLAEVPEALSD
jgi:hypothetical protein